MCDPASGLQYKIIKEGQGPRSRRPLMSFKVKTGRGGGRGGGLFHIAIGVPAGDIHIDLDLEQAVLITNHGRPAFHLTVDTLAVLLTVPPVGPVEDLHLQVGAPCRAQPRTKPRRDAPGSGVMVTRLPSGGILYQVTTRGRIMSCSSCSRMWQCQTYSWPPVRGLSGLPMAAPAGSAG